MAENAETPPPPPPPAALLPALASFERVDLVAAAAQARPMLESTDAEVQAAARDLLARMAPDPWAIRFGMMAAVLPLMYVERGAQMTFVLQSLLLLVSGVYYSVAILPEWMQTLSKFSPATYVLDGVRKGLIEGTPVTELWHDIWPLAIMAVVFIPLGIWVFGRAERYAKRTGKLKRVG